jgi:hypothetical protein
MEKKNTKKIPHLQRYCTRSAIVSHHSKARKFSRQSQRHNQQQRSFTATPKSTRVHSTLLPPYLTARLFVSVGTVRRFSGPATTYLHACRAHPRSPPIPHCATRRRPWVSAVTLALAAHIHSTRYSVVGPHLLRSLFVLSFSPATTSPFRCVILIADAWSACSSHRHDLFLHHHFIIVGAQP